jgi:hypothetical protein
LFNSPARNSNWQRGNNSAVYESFNTKNPGTTEKPAGTYRHAYHSSDPQAVGMLIAYIIMEIHFIYLLGLPKVTINLTSN